MALYEYACPTCGVFEIARPIGTAAAREACPACSDPAPRQFSMPAVTSPRSPLRRARDAADRSAHEPAVTGPPPRQPRPARPPNPLHMRLPRP